MKRITALIIGMLFSFASVAAGPGAVRKTTEASMRVTGEIVVTHEGKVASYVLDQADTMPEEAKQLLRHRVGDRADQSRR